MMHRRRIYYFSPGQIVIATVDVRAINKAFLQKDDKFDKLPKLSNDINEE